MEFHLATIFVVVVVVVVEAMRRKKLGPVLITIRYSLFRSSGNKVAPARWTALSFNSRSEEEERKRHSDKILVHGSFISLNLPAY